MPGIINKKHDSGYPPDWKKIGYQNTPESTLNGFEYALNIKNNWDTSAVTHTERYRGDLNLMYFPKNIDMSNLITIDRMFQASNIEYIELDLSSTQTAQAVFTDCHNIRYAKITNIGITPQLYNLNNFFLECHALEKVEIDLDYIQSDTTINKMFCNCYNLKEFQYDNSTISSTGFIKSATQTFENCYKMEKLRFEDEKCENIGCYGIGKNTDTGCDLKIRIGYNTSGSLASFMASKLKSCNVWVRKITNCQSIFENAVFVFGSGNQYLFTGNNSYMFKNAKLNGNLTNLYVNPTNANGMFDGLLFTNITDKTISLGSNATTVDFSNCTNMQNAFANTNATKIEKIEDADFSSVTNFNNTFYNSPDFDSDTVNGILKALTTASSYSGTKTLATLGFTSANYPASDIQNLSNYTLFTGAGWTIGY